MARRESPLPPNDGAGDRSARPSPRGGRLARVAALGACLAVGAATITPAACRRGAGPVWEDELEAQSSLARGVARWVEAPLDREAFATGSALFDGEWLFATYAMAALGLGQAAESHPSLRERHAALVGLCVDRMISPSLRAFDRERHGDDPLDTLEDGGHHAAYLGYLGVALGMHRRLEPEGRHAALHDRLAAAVAARLEASPIGLVQTYPGEVYPVDNLALFGTLGLHQRATGTDHGAALARFAARLRRGYVDPPTGLLVQSVDTDGRVVDGPRGSGTALGVYFAAMGDRELSRDLWRALRARLARRHLGFGVVNEYPDGVRGGLGDIDSGPVVLGAGLSATGFSLAGARLWGDEAHFRATWATAHLWGAPLTTGDRTEWVNGGPLGNALLFAMITAPHEGFR